MNVSSVNLAARFILEVTALFALAFWGWSLGEGLLRIVYAAGLPIVAATVWGVFAVPEDKSRSGKAPIPVPGLVRLAIEFLFFASAVWALFNLSYTVGAWIFGISVCLHYAFSYKRMLWLIRQGNCVLDRVKSK